MRWMTTMWLLLILAVPANAQAPDPAGQWAVRSRGRVMMIVTLVRDGARRRDNWLRPDRFSTDSAFASLVSVQGPAVARALISATPVADGLDLVFRGRAAGATDRMTFGVRADGTARFVFAQNPQDSFVTLTRVTNGERRVETRPLLDAGALESGADFLHAAFVFQHGGAPDDYLLAHVLATVAVARGGRAATWIAAATLDRYLQSIGKPQVLGAQFSKRDAWTQEPMRVCSSPIRYARRWEHRG